MDRAWERGVRGTRGNGPALTAAGETRDEWIARFKRLTEQALPERARAERWPLRNDHCFKRVCLDHAVQDEWYRHIRKPAERHIAGEALERAVRCAEELLAGDEALLRERNRQSLHWRGKLREDGLRG